MQTGEQLLALLAYKKDSTNTEDDNRYPGKDNDQQKIWILAVVSTLDLVSHDSMMQDGGLTRCFDRIILF
jgi:hypothetical protein